MALETELATFDRHAAELAEHTGEYVLIHGEEIVGLYETYEAAITSGYLSFKLEPFMVKQIGVVEYICFPAYFRCAENGGRPTKTLSYRH